jgi:hypothetical protein
MERSREKLRLEIFWIWLPIGKKETYPILKRIRKFILTADGEAQPLSLIQLVRVKFWWPIQPNMMATVANEGHYYTPISSKKKAQASIKIHWKHVTSIDKKHFKPMIRGLFVYNLERQAHCVSKVSILPVKLERLKTLPRLTEKEFS